MPSLKSILRPSRTALDESFKLAARLPDSCSAFLLGAAGLSVKSLRVRGDQIFSGVLNFSVFFFFTTQLFHSYPAEGVSSGDTETDRPSLLILMTPVAALTSRSIWTKRRLSEVCLKS